MNSVEQRYSPFWALLLFFGAVLVMDLYQTLRIHQEKMAVLQEYNEAVKMQKQADLQLWWIAPLRKDLVQLAPSHPEASQIVAELHLQPPGTKP